MPYDLQAAREAGISDGEIVNALAQKLNYDVEGAMRAGVSEGEIADVLTQRYNSSAPAQPAANAAGSAPKSDVSIFSAPRTSEEQQISKQKHRALLEQGLQGIPILGSFTDEAANLGGAAIAKIATGEPFSDLYKQATALSEERLKRQQKQFPEVSLGAQIGTGLLTGVAGAGTKTGAAIIDRLSSGGRLARTAKGALAGAATGAVYGSGAGDEGERIESSLTGGVIGGALGGALPVLSDVVGKAADKITKKVGQKTGELPEYSGDTAFQKVYSKLSQDFPEGEDFRKQLNSYFSSDKTLLEKGGARTRALGEAASIFESGGTEMQNFFNAEVPKQADKLKKVLSKAVSPSVNYQDSLDAIVSSGREVAGPLYSAAYKANSAVSSPMIDRILRTPEGKSALGEAVKNIRNEMSLAAKPDKELTQMAREMVSLGKMAPSPGGAASGLKLKTLDYIKRSMDDTIRSAYRSGNESEARRIVNLKNGLLSEIDSLDKTGFYAKARATSGDYLSSKEAMDDGLNFLREDPEIVAKGFKEYSPAQKRAYKIGVVKSIRQTIDNKFDGRNVADIFNRESTRQKLSSILNPDQMKSLMSQAKASDDIFKLRNQLLGNSRTAARQIAATEFDDDAMRIATDIATKGASATLVGGLTKMVAKKMSGISDETAGDVARILLESDPKQKFKIVKNLTDLSLLSPNSVRGTEAANKLALFYKSSDLLKSPITSGAAIQTVQRELE